MKRAANEAERIVRKHGTRDPYTLCKYEGVTVISHDLSDIRGYYIEPYGVPIISLSNGLSELARCFVCAHELGHHIYDQGLNRTFMDLYTYMLPSVFENRADLFAYHLLFGESPLQCELDVFDWQLADCLNVDLSRLDSRLIELGVFY